jgi:tetratricopeptide (TPR) repeat protein
MIQGHLYIKKISILLLFSTHFLLAQEATHLYRDLRGDHLFALGYFPSSWQANVFEIDATATGNEKEVPSFNLLSNALRRNDPGAEKMLANFQQSYPNSALAGSIYFDVANYYFDNEKYRYALKWFAKVSELQVPRLQLSKYNFSKGYTLFSAKRYTDAKPYLEKVQDNPEYESDAHYYLGHIAYQSEDFDGAVNQFNNLSNTQQKEDLSYFQADMNFRLGRFEQAIALGKEVLAQPRSEEETSEISKVIGESAFNLGNYAQALPYLKAYKGKKGKWENNDFYQLGYAYYKANNFIEAIDQFNKIINSKDALAQTAYYYLADCYLKTDKKTEALNAFRTASKMKYDQKIIENALLNYATLSYEIGNPFESTADVLQQYLSQYPKSAHYDKVSDMLIDSYTSQGNYDDALVLLENKNEYKNDIVLQQVYFLKAIQTYRSGNYREALDFFDRAIKNGADATYTAHAYYWLGRANYELNRFEDALEAFKNTKNSPRFDRIEEKNRWDYDMAYTYFKLGAYEYALRFFEAFNQTNASLAPDYHFDTFLRLGDCRFALKEYWPAIEFYNTALAMPSKNKAYPLFQKAMSYGFVDRNAKKTEALQMLVDAFPRSSLADDALFELALSFSQEANQEQALATYDRFLNSFKDSPYLPKAALNKGLILYNLGRTSEAQQTLEDLVLKYPKDGVAQQAIMTLKEISIDIGKVSEFSGWVKKNKLNSFSNNELEKATFEAAEKQFVNNNKKQAEKLLEAYLLEYPSGSNNLNATFLLAEIYFESEAFDKALEKYELIAAQEVNEYSEKSLVRAIELLKKKEDYTKLISYLELLSKIASFDENKRFAALNLLQVYYHQNQFEKTRTIALGILENNAIEENLKWDALLLSARSALQLKDTLAALESYKKLERVSTTEMATEALYFKALDLRNKKDFEASNQTITTIANATGHSGIWGPKALMLLAQNYFALNDTFQATYVLESIIENFDQYPNLIEEATLLLSKIKNEASKENASISPGEDE